MYLATSVFITILSAASAAIEVIGAGLGRTGTLSLRDALEELGYEKTYHFIDFGHAKHWADVAKGKASIDSVIDSMIKDGYNATMDNPSADIYLNLFQRFPEAKVILTLRDSPQQFASSWKELYRSIEVTERSFSPKFPSFFQWLPVFLRLKEMRCFMGTTHLGLPPCELLKNWRMHPNGWLEEQYERHNQHVIENIPRDQLLVFNVKDGWEPLCRFLDKPIPKVPFPHPKVNSSESLKKLRKIFVMIVYAWIPVMVVLIISFSICCCWPYEEKEKAD
jgi:hypothetical protein